MIYAALYLVLFSGERPDVVICDQVSACVPFLKTPLAPGRPAKVVFYCHFPDQMLTDRRSVLKKAYRAPLDWFEQLTTGMADIVLVNSKFTAGVFRQTFSRLAVTPTVLYPSLDTKAIDSLQGQTQKGII